MKELSLFLNDNWQILLILLLIFYNRYRTVGLLALAFEIMNRWAEWNASPVVYVFILIGAVCMEIRDGHAYYSDKYEKSVKILQKKYEDNPRRSFPYKVEVVSPSIYVHTAPDFKCSTELTITDKGVYNIGDEVMAKGV